MSNEQYDMLSVSDVAKRLGKTPQTIYNQIKQGLWDTIEYNRGKYKGILIKYPKE